MKDIRETAPRLEQRTVVLQERLSAFVSDCTQKGFSEGETVLLAAMHHALDRVEVQPYAMGRYTLHGMVNACSNKLSKELEKVSTPEGLSMFRANLLQAWWHGRPTMDLAGIRKLQTIVHSKNFQDLLESWEPEKSAELPAGKTVEQALAPYFTRVELDVPVEAPSASLKRITKDSGLHSFSYNAWLYKGEEPWMARQLEHIHAALEKMTGWHGPALGLNGWSSLHVDDVRCPALGSMQMCKMSVSNKRGKSFLGRSFLRLDPWVGWGALGHEWVHSLDALACVVERGEVGVASERSEWVKEHVLNMERTPPEQNPEHVRVWLNAYKNKLQDLASLWGENPVDLDHHVQRWKILMDRVESGETIPNLQEAYRLAQDSPYLNSWEERLAYAYNRAEDYLGGLPAMPFPVAAAMRGTPFERVVAAEGFREFLKSPQIQACWAQAQLPVLEGSLLDELAKRRIRQDQERRERRRSTPVL